MRKEDLENLINSGDNSKLVEVITKNERRIKLGKKTITVKDCLNQYDPYEHDVLDTTKRKNNFIDVPGDEYQDKLTGETKTSYQTEEVEVNRLPLPRQQKIVMVAASFLVGERIKLESNPSTDDEKTVYELLGKVWEDNKLDYKSKEIAKKQMSETHCAELWFDYEDPEYWNGTILEGSTRRPGMMILSESNGDKLYATWDEYHKLIAFSRKYDIVNEIDDTKEERLDIYTETKIINLSRSNVDSTWVKKDRNNPYKVIPVIYYHQPRPEWSNVQPLIDREETNFSNLADNNDYFGDPAMVAIGEVENLPSKGEMGKVFQVKDPSGSGKADVKFVTPEAAAETKKMEFDKLKAEQYELTSTPDISFETMRQLMSNGTSGIALKLLFMDPQMKASDHQETFGECIQRRVNLIIKMLVSFSEFELQYGKKVSVKPRFKPFMPTNEVEQTDLLIKMYEAGMISKRTMLEMSALIKDADEELEKIDKEEKEKPKEEVPTSPKRAQVA